MRKIDVVNKIDYTHTFTSGETQEESIKFSQKVTQTLPPFTKLEAFITATKYTFNTNYIGEFRGVNSGNIIKLRGDWSGVQFYELHITIAQPDGLIWGTIKDGKYVKAVESRYINGRPIDRDGGRSGGRSGDRSDERNANASGSRDSSRGNR